jgi:hypothetical protein
MEHNRSEEQADKGEEARALCKERVEFHRKRAVNEYWAGYWWPFGEVLD